MRMSKSAVVANAAGASANNAGAKAGVKAGVVS